MYTTPESALLNNEMNINVTAPPPSSGLGTGKSAHTHIHIHKMKTTTTLTKTLGGVNCHMILLDKDISQNHNI